MKTIFLFPFFLLSSFLTLAQNADSLTITKEVDSLMQIAKQENQKGNYKKSLSAIQSACQKNKSFFGPQSVQYAGTLHVLANGYNSVFQYDTAELYFKEALNLWEKTRGKKHVDYARSLNDLGLVYLDTRQYDKAAPFFTEAKEIFAQTPGKNHLYYTNAIYNLGRVYLGLGLYTKAESFLLEARDLRQTLFGKSSSWYGYCLFNLGLLYQGAGQYEKAESNFIECKDVFGKTLGTKHPHYANLLMSYANLLWKLGNFKKSEQLYFETLAIQSETVGKKSPDYARTLYNLACLYQVTGRFTESDSLYQKALQTFEETVGKKYLSYSNALKDYALLNQETGRLDKSDRLFEEAANLIEQSLGKENEIYARLQIFHADLYRQTGDLEKALTLHLEGAGRFERVIGRDNFDYIQYLIGRATIYEEMGLDKQAQSSFSEAIRIQQGLLNKSSTYLSIEELNRFIQRFNVNSDAWSSFCYRKPASTSALIPLVADYTLFRHGFLLDNALALNKSLRAAPDSVGAIYDQWREYQLLLSASYSRPVSKRPDTDQLEEQVNSLEKHLLRLVSTLANTKQAVTWQDVRRRLHPAEAAVEFLHFSYSTPRFRAADSSLYAALIFLPNDTIPRFIPLFEEKQLGSIFQAHRERRSDYVNDLYRSAGQGTSAETRKTLRELLWEPLEPYLSGIKTIYFSPSGLLHRLNFGAIPLDEGRVLFDRYNLVQLGSTRQLVAGKSTANATNSAIVMGGIRYDMDSAAINRTNEALPKELRTGIRGDTEFSDTDSTLRGDSWKYLNWTEVEARAIQTILQKSGIETTLKMKYSATEESFKQLGRNTPSPRIIHLATHGFFFPDPGDSRQPPAAAEQAPVFKVSDNPMIRSGLILAGANHAWKTGSPLKPDMEDGILTAYEISQMNLSGTELVVLSACETGLGDIQGNEGVYGLQRAFKIAGVKYLIMSLWQVPDFQTQELMVSFYEKWLEQKMSIPDALHAAQQEMRTEYNNPWYWAGFVLLE